MSDSHLVEFKIKLHRIKCQVIGIESIRTEAEILFLNSKLHSDNFKKIFFTPTWMKQIYLRVNGWHCYAAYIYTIF